MSDPDGLTDMHRTSHLIVGMGLKLKYFSNSEAKRFKFGNDINI